MDSFIINEIRIISFPDADKFSTQTRYPQKRSHLCAHRNLGRDKQKKRTTIYLNYNEHKIRYTVNQSYVHIYLTKIHQSTQCQKQEKKFI